MNSATGVPVLFAHFVGTTKSSDCPETFMSAVPPEAFSDRSQRSKNVLWEISGLSRFSRLEFLRMLRFSDSAVSTSASPKTANAMLPSARQDVVGTRKRRFRSSIACLRIPLPLLHPRCYHHQRTTRGQCNWLCFHCRTLSFPIPSRFIPALSLTPLFPVSKRPDPFVS